MIVLNFGSRTVLAACLADNHFVTNGTAATLEEAMAKFRDSWTKARARL
jgi:hypothetical protein